MIRYTLTELENLWRSSLVETTGRLFCSFIIETTHRYVFNINFTSIFNINFLDSLENSTFYIVINTSYINVQRIYAKFCIIDV